MNEAVKRSLSGFYLLPDFLFHSPLRFLAYIAYRNGKLKVGLVGIPYLVFELFVVEDMKTAIYFENIHAWAERSDFCNTNATLCWQLDPASGRPERIAIRSRLGDFDAEYRETRPPSALWIVPIQSFIAPGADLFTFCKIMRGLRDT